MPPNLSKAWMNFATADLQSAEILFASKSKKANTRRFRLVIWLCHQSIEKLLKGIISAKGKAIVPIHDLVKLHKDASVSLTDAQKQLIEDLNTYYIPPRYPDLHYTIPLPSYTKRTAQYYLQHTKALCLWLKKERIQKK